MTFNRWKSKSLFGIRRCFLHKCYLSVVQNVAHRGPITMGELATTKTPSGTSESLAIPGGSSTRRRKKKTNYLNIKLNFSFKEAQERNKKSSPLVPSSPLHSLLPSNPFTNYVAEVRSTIQYNVFLFARIFKKGFMKFSETYENKRTAR